MKFRRRCGDACLYPRRRGGNVRRLVVKVCPMNDGPINQEPEQGDWTKVSQEVAVANAGY